MNLSIRQKLVAFIVFPTVLIFLVVGGITLLRLNERLEDEARQDAARLAQHYADLLDGRFNTVAQMAHTTAAFVESNPEITEEQLYELLRLNVEQNPLIFGAAIGFQPYSFRPNRRLFCPYVCEDGKGGVRELDIAASYDYDEPIRDWWWRPRESGRPQWTLPYFDEGAGEILMSTYSVPFHRDGEFWGIATVDIPLATLQEEVGLSQLLTDQYVIVDQTGHFVAHPDPKRILGEGMSDIAKRLNRPRLAEAVRRMAAGESGVTSMPDWRGGNGNIWLYYAPIRSTGWAFAAVIPESKALAFVRSNAWLSVIGMVIIFVMVVTAVVLVSKSLTDPIKKLHQAVNVVAEGNLDVEPIEIRSRDEIADLGRAFNQMVIDLRTHIERLAAEQAARKAVEGELEAARKIQASLLPQTFPPYPDRDDLDLHANLIPAKSVAGDFFDFFLIDDNTLVFTISDVSGKGVPAALFMAVARTLLRNLATVTRDPGEMFERCSRMLSEDNPGAMFVTSFLGVFDIAGGIVTYANAGHPPPYRIDAQGNVTSFGESTGTMLGIFDGAVFGTVQERLDPGDHLVLYTDGVTEAETPDGDMLDDAGFIEILREISDGDSVAICDHVCKRVLEFQGDSQSDDVTVLVLGRRTA